MNGCVERALAPEDVVLRRGHAGYPTRLAATADARHAADAVLSERERGAAAPDRASRRGGVAVRAVVQDASEA